MDDVGDVRHNTVGEKGIVHLLAGIADALPFQSVNQRKGGVVVSVEHRCRGIGISRRFREVGYLGFPVFRVNNLNGLAARAGGTDGFIMAVTVLLDEAIGGIQDFRRGTVVFFNQEYLCPGIIPFKMHQGIGVGGAETINALVFIAHHKEIAALAHEQPDKGMLDFRGILGLVHAEIAVLILKGSQHLRVLLQNPLGVHHLIVKIHYPPLQQLRPVLLVNGWEVVNTGFQFADFLGGKHLVFHIGDIRSDVPENAGGCIILVDPLIDFPQEGQYLPFLCQPEGIAAIGLAVEANDAIGKAVDGAKGKAVGILPGELCPEALAHFIGSRHGVGHGENLSGRNAAAINHIAQAGHQHRGLPAARHCQKEHGTVYRQDGLPLTIVEPGKMVFCELFRGY